VTTGLSSGNLVSQFGLTKDTATHREWRMKP
jgi:hypothetical protein